MLNTSPSISDFIQAWPLFEYPVLSGVWAGLLLGGVGVYIVLKRMVFLSATLAQTASFTTTLLLYIAFSFHWILLQEHVVFFASICVCLFLFYIGKKQEKLQHDSESLLALIYLASLAGILMIAPKIPQESHDIQQLLFGNAVAVLAEDYEYLWKVSFGLILLHIWWWKGFVAVTLDMTGAGVRGLPKQLINTILLMSIGIMMTVYSQVLGSLTVFTLSVIPALSAACLGLGLRWTFVLASLLGACAAFTGYLMAFLYDLPVGASQTLCALSIYITCRFWQYYRQEINGKLFKYQ